MTELTFAKQFLTTVDNKNIKYQPDHVFNPKTFALRVPYTLPKLSHPPHPTAPTSIPSSTTAAPGSERATTTSTPATIDVTLKSSRNPTMTLSLPALSPDTPISSLKQRIHTYLSGTASTEKIKILLNKKPIPAAKLTVADAIGDTTISAVEFGVMVIGGAPDPVPVQETGITTRAPEAAGPGSENAAVEAETGLNPDTTPVAMEDVQTTQTETTTTTTTTTSAIVQPGEDSGASVLKTQEFWDDLQGFLEQRIRDQSEAIKLRGIFEQAWKST